MYYRNRKLLDLAHRITECTVQLPEVCEIRTEGCEPAHSNWFEHGKGMGLKAHDCFFAAACHSCHAELDQGNLYTAQQKREAWQRGFDRTLLQIYIEGWIWVK